MKGVSYYYFSFNCAVIHETELLEYPVRDDKGFPCLIIYRRKKKIKLHSTLT